MKQSGKDNRIYMIISIAIWLIIWFLAANYIDNEVFLPSPASVLTSLGTLAVTPQFYLTILKTLGGIALGFLIGFVSGLLLAWLSSLAALLYEIISVPVRLIKSIPVASIVILLLVWLESKHLSTVISAMMVLPLIYQATIGSINETTAKMGNNLRIYSLKYNRRLFYVYLPELKSPLLSACTVAVGFAFKSGIAAEIIGLIRGSIGNELYLSKLYLDIPTLFAWTVVIIIVCFAFEKLILLILKLAFRHK